MPDIESYFTLREIAASAMVRAHEAALEANGADIRRGLEDAMAALADAIAVSPNETSTQRMRRAGEAIHKALRCYDLHKLPEMETLMEQARRDIDTYDVPG